MHVYFRELFVLHNVKKRRVAVVLLAEEEEEKKKKKKEKVKCQFALPASQPWAV